MPQSVEHPGRVSHGNILQQKMRGMEFVMFDLNPSVYRDSERDLTGEEHGVDFLFVGGVTMRERVREQFKERCLVKSANVIALVR